MAGGGLAARAENAFNRRAERGAHTGTAAAKVRTARADHCEYPQQTQLGALHTAPTNNHYPRELADFILSIDCVLNVAGEFLASVDMDLAAVCQLIRRWLREHADKCAIVVKTRGPAVKYMFETVLPALHVATSMSDRHSTASLLAEVLEWSTHQGNGLQDVRSNYLFVLDRTKDLCRCVDLSIDFLNMSSTEEATERGLQLSYLESALAHLVNATRLLEDCSDFWLRLHCAELGFSKIRIEALDVRSSILSEPIPVQVSEICWKLLVMLRNICEADTLIFSGWAAGAEHPSSYDSDHRVVPHDRFGLAGKDSIHINLPTVWGMSC
jgi:hypothetical protein